MILNSGTITSRQNGIIFYGSGNDNNKITNSGTITVDDNGILLAGNGNMITNSGSISSDDNAIYIEGDDNTITNSGTLWTGADGGIGIAVIGDNAVVTNSGTITTTAGTNDGIHISGIAGGGVVTNSGSITSVGDGIDISSNGVTVTNSGSITANGGTSVDGIDVYDNNTIVNSGTITVANGMGINVDNGNNVTNSGTITATSGDGVFAAGSSNIISNSGKVIANAGDSFELRGKSNTLNLNAPSFLAGEINLSGSANTVNVRSGRSHSILWRIKGAADDAVNLSGPVPIFYNANYFGAGDGLLATYDPSGFAASFNSLGDLTRNVSGLVRARQPIAPAAAEEEAPQALAYAAPSSTSGAHDEAFSAVEEAPSRTNGVWISGFGSVSDYDGQGSSLDQDILQGGVAIGFDTALEDGWSLGALIGYGWSNMKSKGTATKSFENDANGAFAALYGQKRIGAAFAEATLAAGFQSHDNERFVNDSQASNGIALAKASYDSWWFAPELRLGVDFETGNGVTITPSAQIRYATQFSDGYTETGTVSAPASVDDNSMGLIETRLELAATKQIRAMHFTGRAGWQYRGNAGEDDVSVTLIGQKQDIGFDANLGHAAFVGLDAGAQLTDNLTLNVTTNAVFGEDSFGAGGQIRLTANF